MRFVLLRDPTTIEIAYGIGETSEEIRKVVFRLSPVMSWEEPSEEQISEADMNPVYGGMRQSPYSTDIAAMCIVWASWPK